MPRSRCGISSVLPIGSGKRFRGVCRPWPEARLKSHGSPGSRPRLDVSRWSDVAIRGSRSSASAWEGARRLLESNPDTSDDRSHTRGRMFVHGMGCSTGAHYRGSRCTPPEVVYEAFLDRRASSRSRRGSQHSLRGQRLTDASGSRVSDCCGTRCRCQARAREGNLPGSNPDSSGGSSRTQVRRPACGRSWTAAARSGDRFCTTREVVRGGQPHR
jgi:hypothetical protein